MAYNLGMVRRKGPPAKPTEEETAAETALLDSVLRATEQLRLRRRELYFGAYEDLRQAFGAPALARVDRALSAYLRERDRSPPDPRQRPRFFYFPDLPSQPYLDPRTQAWAQTLQDGFEVIRDEAIELLRPGLTCIERQHGGKKRRPDLAHGSPLTARPLLTSGPALDGSLVLEPAHVARCLHGFSWCAGLTNVAGVVARCCGPLLCPFVTGVTPLARSLHQLRGLHLLYFVRRPN